MVKSTGIGMGEYILRNFPGPITLRPSRKKWWKLTIGGAAFTVIGILLSFRGDVVGMFGVAFFGICTATGVITLLPGASSLQLDEKGFGFTRFFRTQKFLWSEVGDFGVWTFSRIIKGEGVVFNVAKSRLNILEKINTALAGRNGYLPDAYGLTSEELVQLMTAWQNLALNATSRRAVTVANI
jgi:hypothetical protein